MSAPFKGMSDFKRMFITDPQVEQQRQEAIDAEAARKKNIIDKARTEFIERRTQTPGRPILTTLNNTPRSKSVLDVG